MSLRVGDRVRVRSQAEILATLDDRGCLDGLPFMPQMIDLCGKEFRVLKRAHKLCDTVWGPHPRRMANAVFLDEPRCDGLAYGGCQMECRIVWKEAWLAPETSRAPDARHDRVTADGQLQALVERTSRGTERPDSPGADGKPVYSCQATQMPVATHPQPVWDLRQYVEDYRSGNASLGQVLAALLFLLHDTLTTAGLGLGAFMRWSFDLIQKIRGGPPYPNRRGRIPSGSRTPSVNLGLMPGEIVTVKTYQQVLETVTEELANRGLNFSPEMVPHCGRTFRVGKRLRRIMNEKTGQVLELKNECLVLDGASCVGRFARPFLCPRGMPPYWREIWLERTGSPGSTEASPLGGDTSHSVYTSPETS